MFSWVATTVTRLAFFNNVIVKQSLNLLLKSDRYKRYIWNHLALVFGSGAVVK